MAGGSFRIEVVFSALINRLSDQRSGSRRKQLIEDYFEAAESEHEWTPRYNIAPTQPVPIIRLNPKEPVRELSLARWGLNVTFPLVPPPVRPVPAVMPVIVPRQAHSHAKISAVAFHATAIAAILILGFVTTLQEARVAKRRFNDVRGLANSLIFDVHDSIKDLPGSTPAKKIIVERALQYLSVLARESSGNIGLQRELASAYERLGAVQGDYLENNLGDNQGTLVSYKRALDFRKQVALSSRDWRDRLALATGYRLVAHQLEGNGEHTEARDAIGQAITVSEALNKEQPNNPDVLYELGFDYEISASVGYVGYPGDSVARERVLQDYRRALAVHEVALKLNPGDVRTLYAYSVDLGAIGLILEASDAEEALKYYERCLAIDHKLTQLSTDSRYQRSIAIDYGLIASVYDDLGDYQRAVENNMKDLEIYQELASKDPKNRLLDRGKGIASMNTAASCVRTGQIAQAMEYSNTGLAIIREIATSAPGKSYEQRKLAEALVIRGIVLTAANQPEAAIAEIDHARSIYETMYKGSDAQVKVAAADVKLAEAEAKAGHDPAAVDHYREALNLVQPMGAIGFEPTQLKQFVLLAGLGWQPKDRNGSQRNDYWTWIGHCPSLASKGSQSRVEKAFP